MSFRFRVPSRWNNLSDSFVNADSITSYKNRLDKFWNDSEVMYNSETNIYDITTSRSSRRAHYAAAEEDPDLKPEAQGPITRSYYVWLCMCVCIDPGSGSCIQQRKPMCLLSIRKSLACARASKLTTTNMYACMNVHIYACMYVCLPVTPRNPTFFELVRLLGACLLEPSNMV